MTIRVKMYPHPLGVRGPSGIDQVVLAYAKHLPKFGVEIVHPKDEHFDLVAGHVGTGATIEHPFVCHIHGLHWTADYPCAKWQYAVNRTIVDSVRMASEVTVPSTWVAETFQRDMRFTPHVIPHGIDAAEWEHDMPCAGYVLWNKNRDHDVCDATSVTTLAHMFPKQHFVSTFLPLGAQPLNNVNRIGKIPHDQMKKLVQSAFVYLSTVKETFCIGVLEAMASGVPVLGFDFGGNSVLVKHGYNGYLARPGDFDDLAEGLQFCSQHRDTLGANGKEMARAWTWESAVEKVAEVYRLAITSEPPTVAVVIPCYNLGDKVGRAIESVANQTYQELTDIIVVDDGSTDDGATKSTVESWAVRDGRVHYIRQANSGVATARNDGIGRASGARYIACLDADDAIAPEFVERCVRELEADRSLGIAYTGLWFIKPDGNEGLSPWPGEWNFDAHLKKQNQVPTCAVFRREIWKRLGGYKSRYCPAGAGEEDAEFYMRAGACGYKAKKVDDRGLFVYSWLSGRVSGDKAHEATDWTAWHPWAGDDGDGKHPFASYAAPEMLSHSVRQYDQPTISVIIPVGPGHEEHVINALDSLEAQTFRGWEVIVVWDTNHHLNLDDGGTPNKPEFEHLRQAYPYTRWIFTAECLDENGKPLGMYGQGAGYARNRGAEIARAPLLIFLDADDWLYPKALEKMLYAWNEYQQIVYTDYVNRAIVNDELLGKLQDERRWRATLETYNDGTQLVVSASKTFEYDCELAQRQPEQDERGNYYIWCNVTTLLPRVWHDEIGGFDEDLTSWEDVDYNWRLAKAGKCFIRIAEKLLVYNFHMGHRREKGRQIHKKLLYYISKKHKEIEIVGCRGCGSNRKALPIRSSGVFAAQQQVEQKELPGVDDNDFVLCWYMRSNTGDHQVTGSAIHDKEFPNFIMIPKRKSPPGWSINYGYLPGGRKVKFLVHKADVAAQPHWFQPIEERQAVGVPKAKQEPLPAPAPVPVPETEPRSFDDAQPDTTAQPEIPEQEIDLEQVISSKVEQPPVFELQKIPGVNVNVAERLVAAGCRNRADVAAMGIDGLMMIKGIGEVRAKMILGAASRS